MKGEQLIHIPYEEEFRDKSASFSIDVGMQYVINVLYSFLSSMFHDENKDTRYSNLRKEGILSKAT